MKRFLTYLNNGLFLCFGLLAFDSSALTFKTDGSVVQSSGKVTQGSYSDKFETALAGKKGAQWQYSNEIESPKGYFGGDLFIVGTPLLVINKIPEGADYMVELAKQNGFKSVDTLQKYIISAANSDFLEELELSERDAIIFVANVSDEQLNNLDGAVSEAVSESVSDAVSESVSESVSDAVTDAVSGAVYDSLKDYLDNRHQEMLADGWTFEGVNEFGGNSYSRSCGSGGCE